MPPVSQSPRAAPPQPHRTARPTTSTPSEKNRVQTRKQPASQAYADRPDLFVKYKRPSLNQSAVSENTSDAATAAAAPDDFVQQHEGVALIAPVGDLVLDIQHDKDSPHFSYRVHAATLKSVSPYFDRLLGQTFSEGRAVEKQLAALTLEHATTEAIPLSELPRVTIEHVGQISTKVKSIHPIMTDLLAILHRRDTTGRKVPVSNLANLCVVADRFDCTAAVSRWALAKGILRPSQTLPSEEVQRQKIYVGLLLDYAPWVSRYSTQLIVQGSQRWSLDAVDVSPDTDTPWFDLPRGVEDELYFRRQCILTTLASLVEHCLDAYTGSARQCKLGYDSSAQCDDFQLGQFVRYMAKKRLLDLRPSWVEPDESRHDRPLDVRSLPALLQALRELPAYQVDAHHAHCGPRKRLHQGLAVVEQHLGEHAVGLALPSAAATGSGDVAWSWQSRRPLAQVAVARLASSSVSSSAGGSGGRNGSGSGSRLFVANSWLWADGGGVSGSTGTGTGAGSGGPGGADTIRGLGAGGAKDADR